MNRYSSRELHGLESRTVRELMITVGGRSLFVRIFYRLGSKSPYQEGIM